MKTRTFVPIAGLLLIAAAAAAPGPDGRGPGEEESTLIAGLKQALSIGAEKAVEAVSQPDGYFGNELIKILLPEEIKGVAETLGRLGLQKQVDEFVLSMNRAAEKAAPEALAIFVEAVKGMSFEDALGILNGEQTAATEYLREHTAEPIQEAFLPIISNSMGEVGVTTAFKALMDKIQALPLISVEPVDLDQYVTEKALDGLFLMIGEEEKKIRADPAARVTDLLQEVFKKAAFQP
jgi:hypothetical protein